MTQSAESVKWHLPNLAGVLNKSLDAAVVGPSGARIQFLTQDSRKINSESVFFAVEGASTDGHRYVKAVLKQKPIAVVLAVDGASKAGLSLSDLQTARADGITLFYVDNVAKDFALCLHEFWNRPSEQLFIIGVTGTNGKTTTTHLIEHMLVGMGIPTAVMGTIDHHLGSQTWEAELTTPGAEAIHARLADFRNAGAHAVAMEVSSHALAQGRVRNIHFDVAVFTNLTRDHLDYHKNIEEYHAAKTLLFSDLLRDSKKQNKVGILNAGDARVAMTPVATNAELMFFLNKQDQAAYQRVADRRSSRPVKTLEFGVTNLSSKGCRFDFLAPDGSEIAIHSPLVGAFNAENLAAAVAVTGIVARGDLVKIRSGLSAVSTFAGVRGRLERVPTNGPYDIFVDYAHTDDALKNVLQTLKETLRTRTQETAGRLIVAFGCGGDRDTGKRPLMGRVATSIADLVILTSDNPRTEDPFFILQEIKAGVPADHLDRVLVEPDRARAIQMAIRLIKANDILLVAGKGHETYQIIGKDTRHFDDVEQIKEGLALHADKS